MKKASIPILIVLLIGCTSINLSPECSRYAETKQISNLAGITLRNPTKLIETENDCSAMYSIDDTTFELYYWKYSSNDSFYTKFNHSLIHISNCKGSLCNKLYEFHYTGPPRDLEVTCKQGKIWMNDAGKETEKEINCDILKTIGKNNQKTWKCDYNKIMAENCK
ncbi:hypothetical protein JW851_04050 [Candidatus Woesearchaeota archaeon]|nr:hypothetical protein [Candidatus Woesearchaeota archaeon]